MNADIIGQMSSNLSICFGYVIISFVMSIGGVLLIIGITTAGVWVAKVAINILRKQYAGYLSVWRGTPEVIPDKTSKKVKANQ